MGARTFPFSGVRELKAAQWRRSPQEALKTAHEVPPREGSTTAQEGFEMAQERSEGTVNPSDGSQ
eukprot:1750772-Pyramimonas_sp.AAC.1